MWDFCFFPKSSPPLMTQYNENLLIINQHENENNDDVYSNHLISFSTIRMTLTSWLNRRRRRYLFLILCFPFLLPLLCATWPFLCLAEIFFRICRRRRRRRKTEESVVEEGEDEVGLMQRYLEDQLLLVIGSASERGDDDEIFGVDMEYFANTRPPLH